MKFMISAQLSIHANGKAKSGCSEFPNNHSIWCFRGGGETQSNEVKFYNLNVIISVGHHSP